MADENVAEQLKVLTDLVQQLRAENSRLREEATQQPVERTTAGVSVQSPNPVHNCVPSSAGIVERYVYMPRDRKCPRFSGNPGVDPLSVEEWVDEVKRYLVFRPGSRGEQAMIVLDLLDGEAKTEVRFRPAVDREDSEKIFRILIGVYGCSQSLISLQTQFFQRRQREGESLRVYSHALMTLMDAIKRRDPLCFVSSDLTLRDQFMECVRDGLLRRELLRQVRINPNATFLEVRSEAFRWAEEGELRGNRPRAHSSHTYPVTGRGGEVNVVVAGCADELGDLKESLQRQQKQLDAIMQRLDSAPVAFRPPSAPSTRASRYRFQADGKPICLHCGQPGHIARFCKSDAGGGSGAGGSRGRATVQQQEN